MCVCVGRCLPGLDRDARPQQKPNSKESLESESEHPNRQSINNLMNHPTSILAGPWLRVEKDLAVCGQGVFWSEVRG